MQTMLENLGDLSRRLHVAVPLAQIEGEVGKRLARLAKTVKVPGFRPGHVPIRMVEQQYGPQVRSDVISDAVQTQFADAIRELSMSSNSLRGSAAIVGAALAGLGEAPGRSSEEIAIEASVKALAEAGLTTRHVDAVFVSRMRAFSRGITSGRDMIQSPTTSPSASSSAIMARCNFGVAFMIPLISVSSNLSGIRPASSSGTPFSSTFGAAPRPDFRMNSAPDERPSS